MLFSPHRPVVINAGNFGSADIEIFWPSSLHEKFKAVGVNQLVTVREGAGIVPSKGWVEK